MIDWNHGTTGFAQHCAPSLQERPFWAGGMYVIKKVIAEGWAIVATDYIGLGTEGPHTYLFGESSAVASLDAALRAKSPRRTSARARSCGGIRRAAARHCGPARWRANTPRTSGCAVSPPSRRPPIPALVDNVSNVTGGLIFASYAFAAFDQVYPDITYARYIRPGVQPVLRAMAERCLTDPAIALSVVAVVGTTIDPELFSTDPSYGPLGTHLRENIAPSWIGPPLFLGQGAAIRSCRRPRRTPMSRTCARAGNASTTAAMRFTSTPK